MQLSVIRNDSFGEVQCDFYGDNKNDIWMTREQIGTALGYSEPRKNIAKIHERYKDRLDRFSGVVKVTTPGGIQEVVVYNAKGVYEICRWSRQAKADQFMDWVWDIVEGYRSGKLIQAPVAPTEDKALDIRRAEVLMQMTNVFKDILSPPSIQLIAARAAEIIDPQLSLPRPQISKSYTATQIAEALGISKQKVGRLANLHGLKTSQNGIVILDQARYANKQVENFLYNENGKRAFEELLSQS
jgi:prophage antirepressor-like protein